jgi:hypothetical protein
MTHLRHDPCKAGSFLILQREELPGRLAWGFDLEGLPPFLIRPLSHRNPALHVSKRKHTAIAKRSILGRLAAAP